MKNRLLLLGLLVLLVFGIGLTILFGIGMARLRAHPVMRYTMSKGIHELPAESVGPALEFCAGWQLPSSADQVRAFIDGGREPRLFLRFHTDEDGLAYVERAFVVPDSNYVSIKPDEFTRAGIRIQDVMFVGPGPAHWERMTGSSFFGHDPIESGRMLWPRFGPRILIDTERHIVYMRVTPGLRKWLDKG